VEQRAATMEVGGGRRHTCRGACAALEWITRNGKSEEGGSIAGWGGY
jgi:hypothetical protein